MARSLYRDQSPTIDTARERRWLNPMAIAFSVTFAVLLAVALLQGVKPFYYDSGGYWMLGETYVQHGRFSLLNFDNPLRGYLLPLIDHGLHATGVALEWTDSSLANLFNVFVFTLIGVVLAPRLAEIAWPERRFDLWRRLGLAVLLVVFWRGYLNYPLSDFPALAMVLLALLSIARPTAPLWMLLAGLATGAAIDMRPAYVQLAPIVVVLVIWAWFEQRGAESISITRRTLCMGLLVTGFVAISLPQSLIADRHLGTWSFVPGAAAHLQSLKLTEGLEFQRYDTYVGAGHAPQMVYEDETGRKLLYEQKLHTITGTGQYLGLVMSHPATMGGLLARHAINGLDQRYSTPYIEHLDTGSHRWLRLAGFSLTFLALLRVLWPAARRGLGVARWRYPAVLLLCCVTTLPTDVETRYMLPVYLLGYVLVLARGWPNPIDTTAAGVRRLRPLATIAAAYVLFMAVVWHVASGASSHLHFG